jgi:CheY-like chemotaxis protein
MGLRPTNGHQDAVGQGSSPVPVARPMRRDKAGALSCPTIQRLQRSGFTLGFFNSRGNTASKGFLRKATCPTLKSKSMAVILPAKSAGHNGRHHTEFECVFLTRSEEESLTVSRLLRPAGIRVLPAALLEEADLLMAATNSAVLLTDTDFVGGTWESALEMVAKSHPRAALVLAASQADERFWIDVLERGAFDLVLKPFEAIELQRVLENANAHARSSSVAGRTRAAGQA